jgi:hypothetical protein
VPRWAAETAYQVFGAPQCMKLQEKRSRSSVCLWRHGISHARRRGGG